MADFCIDRPMLRRVFRQTALMDTMMERVGVDPVAAARDSEGTAWYEARSRCIACCSGRQCRDWLSQTPATSKPPPFCHNADFLNRCKRAPTRARYHALSMEKCHGQRSYLSDLPQPARAVATRDAQPEVEA
jgi:hypothetical protein